MLSFISLLVIVFASACSSANTTKDDMIVESKMEAEAIDEMEKEASPMGSNEDDEMKEHTGMDAESKENMQGDASESEMMSEGTQDDMGKEEGEMMDEEAEMPEKSESMDMMDYPEWFKIKLVDVHSGESFALQDYQGKVVLVETMAIWCSNCLKQQQQVKELHGLLAEVEDFISLGLDIDPNENADDLRRFTANNGFDWIYAIAPAELASELADLYGSQMLNPPSTPMLIIDRHGEIHILPFGIKSAEKLKEALEPFLNDGM